MPLRLQLWSWNYEPEPTAMGPIAALWAREMAARGHDVEVIAAHPHYPPDVWPKRLRPYREVRDGIPVLRLPLLIGHGSGLRRIGEELTYALSASLAAAAARTPDVIVVVSPSFLALAPSMLNAHLRRRPWVLWLQDIFPDAATTTGLLESRLAVRPAEALERGAYRSARHIVVISETFAENLSRKGVPTGKLTSIYNPATVEFAEHRGAREETRPRILYMGNIGYSQGLADVVRAFQASEASRRAKLVIVGHGELVGAVRAAIASDAVEVLGLVDRARLETELRRAALGLVSQRSDIEEFNVPSKLMNLMAKSIPVWAHVAPDSETARIVSLSGGGWVSNSAEPWTLGDVLGAMFHSAEELKSRGERALAYARSHFHPSQFADRFEVALTEVTTQGRTPEQRRRAISGKPGQ